jgi:dTDP-4-amino-4,6-dideoxygalactose transaminase
MIPRFKPYLGKEELLAAITPDKSAVEKFEVEFARTFEAKYALAFPYGRSALWSLFKAMDIHDAEIIMPAYTCVVVAHAIVLSGNTPRFVDIMLHDYNMDLNQVAEAITRKTRAIIATHLFGYPLDIDRLAEIVQEAEDRFGHKIWVIQDCAHSFGAKWKGRQVCRAGNAALFGLNISKMITSIFGGMITTNDKVLYEKLKDYRNAHFKKPRFSKTIYRLLYIMAIYLAFNESIYPLIYWLQEKTLILNRWIKAYHLDDRIHFPPDHLDRMLPIEASVGLAQLKKYPEILNKRKEAAVFYDKNLHSREGWIKPLLLDGATYSHYVVRVPKRKKAMQEMAKKGIQLGRVIEYSIPNMAAYKSLDGGAHAINSLRCSIETINLPTWGGEFVAKKVNKLLITTKAC